MILKRFFLFTFILFGVNAYPQSSVFNYWTELCDCSAKFDSTKITREQLQNTFDYLWWAPLIDSDATAWTLDQIDDLSMDELQKECAERINKLQTLDFVDDEFWNRLKNERITYYNSTCRLREYTILAYSNPDTLLSYDLVDSTCIYYRDALIAGGQKMIEAWIKLNELQKRINGDPDNLQRKFDEKFNASNKLEFARLEIMKFGWWNSANHRIPHINTSYNFAEEFERLLTGIECECDEP